MAPFEPFNGVQPDSSEPHNRDYNYERPKHLLITDGESDSDDEGQTTTVEKNGRSAEREKLLNSSILEREKPNVDHVVDDEASVLGAPREAEAQITKEMLTKPVPWRSLPRKDQLLILTLARLAEPLVQKISAQTGLLTGSFTAFQCVTAVFWGRLADKDWLGRKNVLLIGLCGTMVSTIGFGFSRSFWSAVFFRSIGGILNGNVGVIRTMISEIVKEKKYLPKAFLILPVTFNFGVLVGPLLGGYLQDPVSSYPNVFGPGSKLGGDDGVQWMIEYPYALPNLLNACFYILSILLVFFGLQETLVDRLHLPDPGLQAARWIGSLFCRHRRSGDQRYSILPGSTPTALELSSSLHSTPLLPTSPVLRRRPKLRYRRIFTPNVLATMLTHGLVALSVSSFNNLWFIFLSTPRFDPSHPEPPTRTTQRLPFQFTGGLGLDPPTIGLAVGIIGFLGLILQFGVYSNVTFRLGLVTTHRLTLIFTFPIVYLLAPYLVMVHTRSAAPHQADGALMWIAISFLLFGQTVGRTFALPITQILVNNCTPHPSVLGAVHGIGQSVSSGCRTLGPIVFSALYGLGLEKGIVGIAFWVLSLEAMLAAATSLMLREGSGHEIVLEGDEE